MIYTVLIDIEDIWRYRYKYIGMYVEKSAIIAVIIV